MKPKISEEYVQMDEVEWQVFPEASEFYMTFLGPLQFIHPDGTPIAVVGWEQAQGAWQA